MKWSKNNTKLNEKELKKYAYFLNCQIFNSECKELKMSDEAEKFVTAQKQIIGNGEEKITDFWIDHNMSKAVKYLYNILKKMTDDDKKFSLAPISKTKRHFITIDSVGLLVLMKKSETFLLRRESKGADQGEWETLKEKEIRNNPYVCFSEYFNLKCSKKESFSGILETDGVSLCIHFRQVVKDKTEQKFVKRVIAIDPGRVNLVYAIEDDEETVYRLTRNRFYEEFTETKDKKMGEGH